MSVSFLTVIEDVWPIMMLRQRILELEGKVVRAPILYGCKTDWGLIRACLSCASSGADSCGDVCMPVALKLIGHDGSTENGLTTINMNVDG